MTGGADEADDVPNTNGGGTVEDVDDVPKADTGADAGTGPAGETATPNALVNGSGCLNANLNGDAPLESFPKIVGGGIVPPLFEPKLSIPNVRAATGALNADDGPEAEARTVAATAGPSLGGVE